MVTDETAGGAYIARFAMCAIQGARRLALARHAGILQPNAAYMPHYGMYAPPAVWLFIRFPLCASNSLYQKGFFRLR